MEEAEQRRGEEMGLTVKQRQAIVNELRGKYARASKKEKSRILDGFVNLTHLNRSYARCVLWAKRAQVKDRVHRPRGLVYTKAVLLALTEFWHLSDRRCGKRLVPFLRCIIPSPLARGQLDLAPAVRDLLLQMSPATIGRLLDGSGRCTVCMASPILGVLPWVAGSLSRPAWTLPPSPLVQGEGCFSWTSPVSWLWTWWVMTEGRPWMMSTGPLRSRIVVRDERGISGERTSID